LYISSPKSAIDNGRSFDPLFTLIVDDDVDVFVVISPLAAICDVKVDTL